MFLVSEPCLFSRGNDCRSNALAAFLPGIGTGVGRKAWNVKNLRLNIYAVEYRSGEPILVSATFPRRAGATFPCPVCKATWAWIRSHQQLESCRIDGGSLRSGKSDKACFQWFS
jgi:hypothetical protein